MSIPVTLTVGCNLKLSLYSGTLLLLLPSPVFRMELPTIWRYPTQGAGRNLFSKLASRGPKCLRKIRPDGLKKNTLTLVMFSLKHSQCASRSKKRLVAEKSKRRPASTVGYNIPTRILWDSSRCQSVSLYSPGCLCFTIDHNKCR